MVVVVVVVVVVVMVVVVVVVGRWCCGHIEVHYEYLWA